MVRTVNITPGFWEKKSLSALTDAEWESLCDGCGRCCLHKLEDEDTGEIYPTNVACRLLDLDRIVCKKYKHRRRYVANCMLLRQDIDKAVKWLPATCAYKLRHEGKPLYDWHPLISGTQASVQKAGISVRGLAVSEHDAGDYEDHLADWLET